jgi:hypothetical protein
VAITDFLFVRVLPECPAKRESSRLRSVLQGDGGGGRILNRAQNSAL